MTHQPKIPQAAQSPYPLTPPPQEAEGSSAGTPPIVAKPGPTSEQRATGEGQPMTRSRIGLGAVIGVAAAATIATLLFSSRSGAAAGKPAARQRRKAA